MRTIVSALTEGLQTYFDQVYLRSNINQKVDPEKFWDLLDNFNYRSISKISFIQIFDFSTLNTVMISHKNLNRNHSQRVLLQNGNQHYKSIVLGHEITYLVELELKGDTYKV
jgi:hypothetical protein